MDKKFRNQFREWIKLDEQSKILERKLNEIKKKKNQITPNIIEYMNYKKLDNIKINSNYKLNLKNSKQYSGITKKHILKILASKLNKKNAIDLVNLIYDSRQKKENTSIKIIKA